MAEYANTCDMDGRGRRAQIEYTGHSVLNVLVPVAWWLREQSCQWQQGWPVATLGCNPLCVSGVDDDVARCTCGSSLYIYVTERAIITWKGAYVPM